MKAIVLIVALLSMPFLMFSQRENGKKHYKKNKHGKESYVYIKPFYGPPKIVYITKKHSVPPAWAPAEGYKHRNVYFPQYKCYYDNHDGVYIYSSGKNWVRTMAPPEFMTNVDLSSATKVELESDVSEPQVYFEQHIKRYPPIP